MTRFDDEFSGTLEPEQDEPRARSVNPFEIALWALGVVLLVGGIVLMQWSVGGLGRSSGPGSADFIATQMVFSLAPVAVTAGLFAIIVSLALRAALLVLDRRASVVVAASRAPLAVDSTQTSPAEPPQSAPAAALSPQADPLQFAPPQLRSRRRAVDHSAFRRPPAE